MKEQRIRELLKEEVAANMIRGGETDEKIMQYTSMSREDVEAERKNLQLN